MFTFKKLISVENHGTGRELFDQVAQTIGLREIWYFGQDLNFLNKKYKMLVTKRLQLRNWNIDNSLKITFQGQKRR